jgi:hypothetical protein
LPTSVFTYVCIGKRLTGHKAVISVLNYWTFAAVLIFALALILAKPFVLALALILAVMLVIPLP